jgi:folate-binding protein YgfZ
MKQASFYELTSQRGMIHLCGKDSLDLLDRLSTNKLTDLTSAGMGMGSVLTTNKGRIIDLIYLYVFQDRIAVTTSFEATQKVIDWLDFYIFTEDVKIKNISSDIVYFRIFNPTHLTDLENVMSENMFSAKNGLLEQIPCTFINQRVGNIPCLDLITNSSNEIKIKDFLSNQGNEILKKDYEKIRIQAGDPVFNAELSEDYNPLEAGLKKYVNFNKGCYIGQEVVARLDTYDKVQRSLVRLSWSGELKGRSLLYQEKKVGAITSVSGNIGLGYVHKKALESTKPYLICEGKSVNVEAVLTN